MNFIRTAAYLFAGFLLVVTGALAEEPNSNFITIGTGSRNAIYYPVGRAISTLVNQSRDHHGLRCSVESTHGSVYNLSTLHKGEFELCISQSDQILDAYNGESTFTKQGPFKELRTLCSLYMEPLTIITRKGEANIRSATDLKEKLVFIGQPDSGHRATVSALVKQLGWNLNDIHEPKAKLKLTSPLALQALCKHEIDAVALVIGHPYQPLVNAAATCALEIMELGSKVDQVVKSHPAYYDAFIPGSLYANNPEPIKSMGVVATLVSTSTVDEEIIYQVVKALFEHLDQFKSSHPRLNNLTRKGMVNQGLVVPLHDGAKRYYIESGLIVASGD